LGLTLALNSSLQVAVIPARQKNKCSETAQPEVPSHPRPTVPNCELQFKIGAPSTGLVLLGVPPGARGRQQNPSGKIRSTLMPAMTSVTHPLGRTGVLAARVLIEHGLAAEQSVAKVRAARLPTIETAAQMRFVPGLGGLPPTPRPDLQERTLACLLGGAVGDAFGYAVEFDKLATIQRKRGPNGLQEPVYHGGQLIVSDDTQMTMFTLEGILCASERVAAGAWDDLNLEIWNAYRRWLQPPRLGA
jgi:hypothetical protein